MGRCVGRIGNAFFLILIPATWKSQLAKVPFQNLKRRSAFASIRRALSVVPIHAETAPTNVEAGNIHAHTSE